jgi:hypothetical protein
MRNGKRKSSRGDGFSVGSALKLPSGRMLTDSLFGWVEVASMSNESVSVAATILIANNDTEGLGTKADVIARAGNLYGFGSGAYQVLNP